MLQRRFGEDEHVAEMWHFVAVVVVKLISLV